MPVSRTKDCTLVPAPDVDEVSGDRRGGGHGRRAEMRAPALALTPLEVAVRRRGTALAGAEDVGVHAQAHGASGLSPLEAGLFEHAVEALLLGLALHQHRAGDDHRAHA